MQPCIEPQFGLNPHSFSADSAVDTCGLKASDASQDNYWQVAEGASFQELTKRYAPPWS